MTSSRFNKLFIVDDDLLIQSIIEDACRPLVDDVCMFDNIDTAIIEANRIKGHQPSTNPNQFSFAWVIDLGMSFGSQGMSGIKWIGMEKPNDPIIVLSRETSTSVAWIAMSFGARAYIPKDVNSVKELQKAITLFSVGKPYSNEFMEGLPKDNPSIIARLTKGQQKTLIQLSLASNQSEVAENLGVNKATVSRAIGAIEHKTKTSLTDLIEIIRKEGWNA